ncbi:hypothetical protein BUALT_Bualt01G0095000 [Buddleja alternifolia]|uniref:AT3G52170-like helix-turn-helix domain-containing protein n=1 Tax=Buddleja alternifolia TaxID=168488 RepID=A0AAV6Y6U8_9LAMI|nr:hypothetical protein BUALT_Bualt01G0095000 [Buddleja alternifolia]
MHAIKGGWAGQAFALASSNDAGGKKSRIRRSKEERKAMVESFINKYQKSNDGIFPSLNLTHKEVGGSFYTVREIVREIIQENRVLAPPKVSLDEHGHFRFLQQNPLGSISVEPENDLSVSDKLHIVAPQITTEELISSSSTHLKGPDPLELNDEQIVNGLSKTPEKDEGSDRANISPTIPNQYQVKYVEEVSNSSENLPQSRSEEFENEKVVNGGELFEESLDSDKPLITNGVPIYNQDSKDGVKDAEVSQAVTFHVNSNFVVEKFPLRPVSRIIHDLDGQSGKLGEAAGINHGHSVEESAINHDKMMVVESSSGLVNEKEKEYDSIVKLNGEYGDEKVVLNVHGPSFDVADVSDIESKATTKASDSTEGLISKDSTAIGSKTIAQYKNDLTKGSNPVLDRINLETWEGASKRPEKNPLLTLVKSFISAFVKFWTE